MFVHMFKDENHFHLKLTFLTNLYEMARMCLNCCAVRHQIHPLENITDIKPEDEEEGVEIEDMVSFMITVVN